MRVYLRRMILGNALWPKLFLSNLSSSVHIGVAFGKAGEERANEESMVQAISMAIDFTKKIKIKK